MRYGAFSGPLFQDSTNFPRCPVLALVVNDCQFFGFRVEWNGNLFELAMAKDYYDILGVPKGASQDDIKKAFRKLAHQHHPDKKHGDEAKFKELNEAYGILSDPEKRARYDRFGHAGTQGGPGGGPGFGGFDFNDFQFGGGSGFEDIFSDLFGRGGGFPGGTHGSRAGADIETDVEVTFDEMVAGTRKTIRIRKPIVCAACQGTGGEPGSKEETCSTCGGSGRITKTVRSFLGTFAQASPCPKCHGKGKRFAKECSSCHGEGKTVGEERIDFDIPAGIEDGQTISIAGKGAAGGHGMPPGDLFVTVHVRPHPSFERRGDTILSSVDIGFTQAALGDTIPVGTVHGPVRMKIPAGTQPGEVFRIKGKGLRNYRGWGSGDHLVTVRIAVPKKLSAAERDLIERLAKLGGKGK